MKSYKEYYQIGLSHHLDWKSKQDTEWWKERSLIGHLDLKGDYIETVKFLSVDEKNDASLFVNSTNVKNSEWGILFDMLGQALVDWCVENVDYSNLWSFDFRVDKYFEDGKIFYVPKFKVTNFTAKGNWPETAEETNEEKLKDFEGCKDFLVDLTVRFIESHGKNIPNDWNSFSFGLDSLYDSCKWGKWVSSSDGYMNLLNVNGEDYDQFVECM